MPLRWNTLLAAGLVAIAAHEAPAVAAPAPASRLQAIEAAYDQQALSLSFTAVPRYAIERVSPTHFVVWLENTRLGMPAGRAGTLGPHAWAFSEQADALRLEVTLASPGNPVVALEDGRRLVVMPQVASTVPVSPDGITTILGRAAFDPALDGLVVPYYGQSPQLQVSAAGPSAVQIDLANAAVTPSGLQLARLDEHPLVTAWSLTRLPQQAASRVTLSYRYPGGATVRVDEPNHRLVITPVLGNAAAPRYQATAVTSVEMIARRKMPTAWLTGTPLVRPAAPKAAANGLARTTQPTRIVIDVPAGQAVYGLPALPNGTSAPVPAGMPTPRPAETVPAVTATPAAPSPAPSAEPTPTMSASSLPPVRRLALQVRPEWTSEALIAGAVDFGPALVPAVGLTGRYDLDADWTTSGTFSYRDYTLQDAGAPDSRHHRDDFQLDLGAAYRFPTGAWQPFLGLGYYARQVSVASNAPPSLARPFVFAPTQFFHGPVVTGGVEGELGAGWRAELALSSRPYVFTGGHETVSSLGALFGYAARPAVSWTWNGVEATLGYQVDYLTAYTNDFTHLKHGPVIDAAWRF